MRSASALLTLTATFCCWFAGCGGGATSGTPNPSGTAPSILTSPLDRTVPLASSTTFAVTALGSEPLRYQWSVNGNAVPGATQAMYTSAPVTQANTGDSVTVTVTNAYGSATSSAAHIALGARTPDLRDLRFKHVGFQSDLSTRLTSNIVAGVPGNSSTFTISDGTTWGSALTLGNASCTARVPPANCGWTFLIDNAPASATGFASQYTSRSLSGLSADLLSLAQQARTVVTSLDEQPGLGIYALSLEQDGIAGASFALQNQACSAADLQRTVQDLAARGAVVTAASTNSAGTIDVLAYTWTGAGTETYEASSVITDYRNVAQSAQGLSSAGYVLTAVGSADSDRVVLVGTRVRGDSLPRPIGIVLDSGPVSAVSKNMVRVGGLIGANPATSLVYRSEFYQ